MVKRTQKSLDPMFISAARKKELRRLIKKAFEIYPFSEAMRDVARELKEGKIESI